ncbi:MAG: ribosomal-processing cysteine protease Prp [Oscillospiraceae bacterium]|nr:ribosomal-processing cysteine protease Prp [Oscillospiraceae bacterium]
MIHTRICEEPATGRLILQLKGHAGAAAEGQDLICAAASILTYTAAQFFSYLYAEGKLRCEPELGLEKGNCYLSAKPREGCYEEALHGLYVLCLGYGLLARQYPKHLQLRAFDA